MRKTNREVSMRQWRVLLVGLLAACLVGCVTGKPVETTSLLQRFYPFRGPSGPDVIQMDLALIEGPVGDRYMNEELWQVADEQAVSPEKRAVLEDNGFRVGQIGGVTPAGLQERLTSHRTCPNPDRLQLHAGNPASVFIGPPQGRCRYSIHQESGSVPVDLEQAQCLLVVVPSLTGDGRTRLQFTPHVQSGKARHFFGPAPDRSGWLFQEQQPVERYSTLAWEVSLAPNEYVIVGACFDRADTLGHRCFIRPDENAPRQRLLVIRTGRVIAGVASENALSETVDDSTGRSPPLALQAAWPADGEAGADGRRDAAPRFRGGRE
jgi:hypothetical protein